MGKGEGGGRRKRGERGRQGESEGGREKERERRKRGGERDLNFPSGRGAVARQGLAEGRDWRAPPAAAGAPARLAELHEAAAGAGVAKGTTSLNTAGALQWLRLLQGLPGRCWLWAGRAEPGCGQQGPGSHLKAAGQLGKLGGTAFGGQLPRTAGSRKGRLRGSS